MPQAPSIWNRAGLHLPVLFRQSRSWGMPNIVIIETTNLCDKECRVCVHKSMTRQKGCMEFGLFKRIVDQIPFAEVVFPYFLGEPLLHQDIYEMIKYCKSRGLYTSISTNGKLLDEDNCKKIVDAGLDHLQISLNSTDEAGYKTIDPEGDFQAIVDNIEGFLRINKGRLDFNISVLNTGRWMKDWQAFAKSFSIRGANVRFKPFVDWNAREESIKKFGSSPQRQRRDVYPCDWLWRQLHILWDGKVIPCCFDYDGTQILGDVNNESVASIWNGPAFENMRKAHLTDGSSIPLCAGCNRRRIPAYETPLHILLNASTIYKLRRHYEKKPENTSARTCK